MTRLRSSRVRGIVRDYCLEFLDENPDAKAEEAIVAIKSRLKDDFTGSAWLEVLLVLVEVLLPLLLELLNRSDA